MSVVYERGAFEMDGYSVTMICEPVHNRYTHKSVQPALAQG
jgi:hypothetical protein